MKLPRRLAFLSSSLVAFSLSACGDPPASCTQIGCDDGIFLTFQTPSGADVLRFAGSVTIAGDVLEVDCGTDDSTAEYLCLRNTLQITGVFDVTEVALNIASLDDPELRYIGAVGLEFDELQPNGPSCPPTCVQASRVVTLEITES